MTTKTTQPAHQPSQHELTPVRRSIFPGGQDNWQSIAARELAHLPLEDAVSQLQSWNLHLFMRPAAPAESARAGNPILPSDVVFLEPPLASSAE